MRETRKTGETELVGLRRLRPIRHDRRNQADMAGPEPPQVQIAHPVAVDLKTRAHFADELRMTAAPASAITGSIHVQPKNRPARSARIASIEVMASASTCT